MEQTYEEYVAQRRNEILFSVDDRSCGACGTPVPDGAADDPEWFVDTEVCDGTELATIRCPKCW